ncbi:MAG TPA: extracellular solute-binding protein [Alphaproteobacteria bacterium]
MLACIASLVLVATSRAETIETIANLTGAGRQQVLEDGAKREGSVVWSGGVGEEMRAALAKAFLAKYPFLKVESQRLVANTAAQRVVSEFSAKTSRTDLVAGNYLVELKKAGLVQPFRSPQIDAQPQDFQEPNRLYGAYRFAYHGLAYNTKLVSDAEAPHSYEDLLDPKWRGKIVWNHSTDAGAPMLITYFRRLWGEDRAGRYLQRLALQAVATAPGSARETLDSVAAGKKSIMIGASLHQVAAMRAQGAPIDASMQDPVLARDNYLLLLKNAPHPHAAMLFIDFLLDHQAQEILRGDQFYPANPDVDPPEVMMPYDPLRHGLKQLTVTDEMIAAERGKSLSLFREYFRDATPTR